MTISDWAAWWGAIVATIVVIWDVYKWKQTGRPKLRVSASPSMNVYGPVPNVDANGTYVCVEVVNIGDKRTELTHVVGLYYKNWFQKVKGKTESTFLVVNPAFSVQFPTMLDPGERWIGGVEQNDELVEMSRSGYLYCGVFHSASKNPITERVVVKD